MAIYSSNILLITANVGSLFEDPENMLKVWVDQLLHVIQSKSPEFVAIHCQEVGGKTYEDSMQFVDYFIKMLLTSHVLQIYNRVRIYLDQDITSEESFTALGCLYFIHQDVTDISMWDFKEGKFVSVDDKQIYSGNIENTTTLEKCKFPLNFFPDGRYSRKGYTRTRWQISNVQFDLVNIHLFHDANNLLPAQSFPSKFVLCRRNALEWLLDRIQSDSLENLPYFVFGDFNFRLDSASLIKHLTHCSQPEKLFSSRRNSIKQLAFKHPQNGLTVTVEKKKFDLHDHHRDFFDSSSTFRKFDSEIMHFEQRLREFEFDFPPSYPFSEELKNCQSYGTTRCPSWCDRILMSPNCLDLIITNSNDCLSPDYKMFGKEVCMGDHKPIYLFLHLRSPLGMSVDNGMNVVSSCMSTSNSVVNINGCPTPNHSPFSDWSVFDWATFTKEEELLPAFRLSYKHYVYTGKQQTEVSYDKPGFSSTVRNVILAGSVIAAFKSERLRRMSETSAEDEEDEDKDDCVRI